MKEKNIYIYICPIISPIRERRGHCKNIALDDFSLFIYPDSQNKSHKHTHIHTQTQQHTVTVQVGLSVPAVTTDSRCPHALARYCGKRDNQAVEGRVQMHLITVSRQQGRPGQRDSLWNVLYCKCEQGKKPTSISSSDRYLI